MENDQLYLNNELDLDMLAEHLAISPNLLSQIINQKTRQNFYGLINQFRVQHAQRLLQQQQDSLHEKTVLEIAIKSGFNTKSSFYRNFKKNTGHTPTSYRETTLVD